MTNILSQNAFWIVNKSIAKEVGLDAALLLSDLVTKQEYFNEEWFFNTADNIEEDTTLSPHQQRKAIKVLIDKGFIETKLKGLPAKQHFKIINSKLLNFLTTCCENIEELYNKNKPNNNKYNKGAEQKNSDTKIKSLFNILKYEFEEIFIAHSGSAYYFTGKDGAKIKSIINKLKHAYKTKGFQEVTDEQIKNGFLHICKKAKQDKWLSNNFTLSNIDSQFNNLKINKRNENTDLQSAATNLFNKYASE